MQKGCRGKIVWKQALRPFQESFLEMEKSQPAEARPAFDVTFYPVFQNISNVLQNVKFSAYLAFLNFHMHYE